MRVSWTLRETSASLFRIQQKLKGEACRAKREEMQEEILRLQQTLKTDMEAKDTASRMRISTVTFIKPELEKCSLRLSTASKMPTVVGI